MKQRAVDDEVNLGGLFGHEDVPAGKTDKKGPASKRGAAARRAVQDAEGDESGNNLLSPHSPLRVRRSTRATRTAVRYDAGLCVLCVLSACVNISACSHSVCVWWFGNLFGREQRG